jgi:hypothetical protein
VVDLVEGVAFKRARKRGSEVGVEELEARVVVGEIDAPTGGEVVDDGDVIAPAQESVDEV